MAGAGEHTDVLSVISTSQTPSFTQLRSLNPRLAVLFSARLRSGSPPLNQKHITLSLNLLPASSEPTDVQRDDGGQVKEIKQR